MSAYMVADKTINRILTYLNGDLEIRAFFLKEAGLAVGMNDDDLGRALLRMNADAVSDRYGERPFDSSTFHYKAVKASPIQVVKSIACFGYQSCEGDVPETKLYKALRALEGRVSLRIVRDMPKWAEAEWG